MSIRFDMKPLLYGLSDLSPVISHKTQYIHYEVLYRRYTNKLNAALESFGDQGCTTIEEILSAINSKIGKSLEAAQIRDQGGGYLNHSQFFSVLSPHGGGEPLQHTAAFLRKHFGSVNAFREAFCMAGVRHFASGWVWLVAMGNGHVGCYATSNQSNPVMWGHVPIFGVDLWEHAYFLDYGASRADYLKRIWEIIDWQEVERRVFTYLGHWGIH